MSSPNSKRRKTNDGRTELSIGRPQYRPESGTFFCDNSSLKIIRAVESVQLENVLSKVETLRDALNSRKGAFFESAYEYPGRYARWTMGFVDPPLQITWSWIDWRD